MNIKILTAEVTAEGHILLTHEPIKEGEGVVASGVGAVIFAPALVTNNSQTTSETTKVLYTAVRNPAFGKGVPYLPYFVDPATGTFVGYAPGFDLSPLTGDPVHHTTVRYKIGDDLINPNGEKV